MAPSDINLTSIALMKYSLRSISIGIALTSALGLAPRVSWGQSAMPQAATSVQVDAIATRASMIDARARVDVYIIVPYELLEFTEYNDVYAAKYDVHVSIRDSLGRRAADTTYTHTATERDYAVSRGSTGGIDHSVPSFRIKPGDYKVDVTIRDQFSRKELTKNRTVHVPDFTTDLPAFSSILFVSDIEQRGTRYSLTPLIGDVIWNSDGQLFAFYELYLDDSPETVGTRWTLTSKEGKVLSSGTGPIETITGRTGRQFFRINIPQHPLPGTYTLDVKLYEASGKKLDTSSSIAQQQRALVIPPSAYGSVVSDLAKAIRQLRYVATQADMDYINEGTTEADKQSRFEEFWKRLDPTPNTIRNEAFEDYYGRIERVNRTYKSYADGWLTDMGMVAIIYGEPVNVERYGSSTGTSRYVRWTMANNMQFNFEDTAGFGDFRLRTPLMPGAKYQYRR